MSRDEFAAEENNTPAASLGRLKRLLPSITFATVHHVYFIGVCLLSSLVFWGSSSDGLHVSYVDSLFLVVSAMTETGLNTVNLSQLNTWQQIILFLLILFGGLVWVSIWPVMARKRIFDRRIDAILSARHHQEDLPLESPGPHGILSSVTPAQVGSGDVESPGEILEEARDIWGNGKPSIFALVKRTMASRQSEKGGLATISSLQEVWDNGSLGKRNKAARSLASERDQLGGAEYRALKLLSIVVPLYFVVWQLLGCLALSLWIQKNLPDPALANVINPIWLGIFNGASAFNNSGMSLLDANMGPFNQSYFVLLTMGLLILAGNTAYPVFLRMFLWSWSKLMIACTAETSMAQLKDTLVYILERPRRVHTHMFPSTATWWLACMVVLLNAIMWVAFELLNIGNPIIEGLPKAARVVDGLFQAFAMRSGGFMVVPMSSLYIGLLVLYAIMMYIPAHPVNIHSSNTYDDRSIVIYSADDLQEPRWATNPDVAKPKDALRSFISHQLYGTIATDAWWLALAVLVIATIETRHFLGDPVTWSVFNIIFEVVSAYGCVGVSTGVPFDMFSFSGGWQASSKIVLCLVMLRGRHRGLPVALDHEVVLAW